MLIFLKFEIRVTVKSFANECRKESHPELKVVNKYKQ